MHIAVLEPVTIILKYLWSRVAVLCANEADIGHNQMSTAIRRYGCVTVSQCIVVTRKHACLLELNTANVVQRLQCDACQSVQFSVFLIDVALAPAP